MEFIMHTFSKSRTIVLWLMLMFPLYSQAQTSVAIIDLDVAMEQADYTKAKLEALKNDPSFQKNYEIFRSVRKELEQLKQTAAVNSVTWSEEQNKKHAELVQQKINEGNKAGKVLDQLRLTVKNEVNQAMAPVMNKAVLELIEEKKIDVLLSAQSIHYIKPELELTGELIAKLNQLKPVK